MKVDIYVYQIWYETEVGPTFAKEREALDYLGAWSIASLKEITGGYGYPMIQKIKLGDRSFMRDR